MTAAEPGSFGRDAWIAEEAILGVCHCEGTGGMSTLSIDLEAPAIANCGSAQ